MNLALYLYARSNVLRDDKRRRIFYMRGVFMCVSSYDVLLRYAWIITNLFEKSKRAYRIAVHTHTPSHSRFQSRSL